MTKKWILKTELGNKVLATLWHDRKGLTGYEIGKKVFGLGTQGKTYTILKELKKAHLVNKKKDGYFLNFTGLLNLIEKELPDSDQFNLNEKEELIELISKINLGKVEGSERIFSTLLVILAQWGWFGLAYGNNEKIAEKLDRLEGVIKMKDRELSKADISLFKEVLDLPKSLLLKLTKLLPETNLLKLMKEVSVGRGRR